MNQTIAVKVSGIQFYPGAAPDEPIEVETEGTYRMVNGRHHIKYDEMLGGTSDTTRNHIIISENAVTVRKAGPVTMEMVFEPNKTCMTQYATPFGTIYMAVTTSYIRTIIEDDAISAQIHYSLAVNSNRIADCTMDMSFHSMKEEDSFIKREEDEEDPADL